MRRKNKYPGVSRQVDRHGRVRWRFRRGTTDVYLQSEYGSPDFIAEYSRAANLKPPLAPRGTFSRLIEDYRKTTSFANLSPVTRKNQNSEMEVFREKYGERSYSTLNRKHIEAIMLQRKDTPAAANKMLKMLKRLYRFAQKDNAAVANPTIDVKPFRLNSEGFHTWTEDEVRQYIDRHPPGTKAHDALILLLYTGASRQDAARMTRNHLTGGRVRFSRGKTGMIVDLPIHNELAKVLDRGIATTMPIIPRQDGKAYSVEGFGIWFREQCNAAGLKGCSAHGLRKSGATRMAEAGCTSYEIAAFLGHRTDREAQTYVAKANRGVLADRGFDKLTESRGSKNDD